MRRNQAALFRCRRRREEALIKIYSGKILETPYVVSYKLKSLSLVQGGDELSRKILVQQDFHTGCNSF